MSFKRLDYGQRKKIRKLRHHRKFSLTQIAEKVGVSVSTVSRELRRNTRLLVKNNSRKIVTYDEKTAQAKAVARRSLASHRLFKIESNEQLCQYVVKKLNSGWSVPLIVKHVENDTGTSLTARTLYSFLKRHRIKASPGRKKRISLQAITDFTAPSQWDNRQFKRVYQQSLETIRKVDNSNITKTNEQKKPQ